jgi:hypothetical protein
MLSALYCSFWPSYRDVVTDGPAFGPGQAAGEAPPAA